MKDVEDAVAGTEQNISVFEKSMKDVEDAVAGIEQNRRCPRLGRW